MTAPSVIADAAPGFDPELVRQMREGFARRLAIMAPHDTLAAKRAALVQAGEMETSTAEACQ